MQLGINYNGFVDRIYFMFAKILEALPRYEAWATLLSDRNHNVSSALEPRIGQVIACIYVDLLQFCQDISRLFCIKSCQSYNPLKNVHHDVDSLTT